MHMHMYMYMYIYIYVNMYILYTYDLFQSYGMGWHGYIFHRLAMVPVIPSPHYKYSSTYRSLPLDLFIPKPRPRNNAIVLQRQFPSVNSRS